MNIPLYKLKKEKFDDVLNSVVSNYRTTKSISIDEALLEESKEPIFQNGSIVTVEIDIDYYKTIASMPGINKYEKNAKIGMQLHKEFNLENSLPKSLLYEKELWAYLSLTTFFDIVKEIKLDDDEKITEDKIKRVYFNAGTPSRTCLLFVWSMIDKLDAEENYERAITAFEFVDPVKAIYERTFSKNPLILRAFVQGIINNDRDAKFKDKVYRFRVPSNISCFAAVNMLDMYPYEELVKVITEQQKLIIS